MGLADFVKQKLIDSLQKSVSGEEVSENEYEEERQQEQTPQYSDEAIIAIQERFKREAELDAEKEKEERQREREEKKELKRKVDEINKAPMPEAKDIVLEIKTCEQNSDNYSFSYEEQHAYESRANILKEYAKQKYANDPAVKAYLRKEAIHNHRFLIMWCVFLVAAVIIFILCEEWWHYVLAVLGTIVVAVVLFFIKAFGD